MHVYVRVSVYVCVCITKGDFGTVRPVSATSPGKTLIGTPFFHIFLFCLFSFLFYCCFCREYIAPEVQDGEEFSFVTFFGYLWELYYSDTHVQWTCFPSALLFMR
jgi:hypothetical protein